MATLHAIGQRLVADLEQAQHTDDAHRRAMAHEEKVNIVGAGGALTAAYEQLRNAAENTEEHLLLQNAIRRFYKQLFITRDDSLIQSSGNELAIELTFAGYIANDILTKSQISDITTLATGHYRLYEDLLKHRSIPADTSSNWVLDTLSVQIESILNSHLRDAAFINFAYEYFQMVIPRTGIVAKGSKGDQYGAALFAAIHKALLKSNTAVIRTALMQRYMVSMNSVEEYASFNQRIDALLSSNSTEKLYRVVDRQGAPLRIMRRMIDEQPEFLRWLPRQEVFLDKFEQQVNKEYTRIGKRINRAIVRSVAFLIITKFIIGIAIEVPYDFWAHGEIIWVPLLVNLIFPPLYMVALRLTHALPGFANTTALVDRADAMLYGEKTILVKRDLAGQRYGAVFSSLYMLFGVAIFGFVMWGLLMLNFSLVHIAIFFIFISAASFLGFRLSRLIRELEIVRSSSNGLTFLRDVIYLPFVVVGQWMSEKYSQINIVATVLDMLIELPLKTILRLVRQWGAFIDDRKDRI